MPRENLAYRPTEKSALDQEVELDQDKKNSRVSELAAGKSKKTSHFVDDLPLVDPHKPDGTRKTIDERRAEAQAVRYEKAKRIPGTPEYLDYMEKLKAQKQNRVPAEPRQPHEEKAAAAEAAHRNRVAKMEHEDAYRRLEKDGRTKRPETPEQKLARQSKEFNNRRKIDRFFGDVAPLQAPKQKTPEEIAATQAHIEEKLAKLPVKRYDTVKVNKGQLPAVEKTRPMETRTITPSVPVEERMPDLSEQMKMIQTADATIEKKRADIADKRKKTLERWQKEQTIALRNKLDELLQLRKKLGEIKVGGILGLFKTKLETYFSGQPTINVNSPDEKLDQFINSAAPLQGLTTKEKGILEKLVPKIKNATEQNIITDYLVSLGQYTHLIEEQRNQSYADNTDEETGDGYNTIQNSGLSKKGKIALVTGGAAAAVAAGAIAYNASQRDKNTHEIDMRSQPTEIRQEVSEEELAGITGPQSLLEEWGAKTAIKASAQHQKSITRAFSAPRQHPKENSVQQTNETQARQDLEDAKIAEQREEVYRISRAYEKKFPNSRVAVLPERTDLQGNTMFTVEIKDENGRRQVVVDLKNKTLE